MDWFERLTGFEEATGPEGYARTRQRLEIDGDRLRSRVNGRSFGIGRLELMSLQALRERALAGGPVAGPCRVRLVHGDVRKLHQEPAFAGALFQVASQFNLPEMTGPDVTPEHGVTRYERDRTQGPACAIAAGAATLYRNYFAPVGGAAGQTRGRQLDGFAALGAGLAQAVGQPAQQLWTMRNGYAMFERDAVDAISYRLEALDEQALDALRRRLQIGLHWDVEVTDGDASPGPLVSQAFCSALPVSYNDRDGTRGAHWAPVATLVLQAAYEATLWAAVINAQRGGSKTVLLTLLGGGAFGNDEAWIRIAIGRTVAEVAGHGLDIALVSFAPPSEETRRWVASLGQAAARK